MRKKLLDLFFVAPLVLAALTISWLVLSHMWFSIYEVIATKNWTSLVSMALGVWVFAAAIYFMEIDE